MTPAPDTTRSAPESRWALLLRLPLLLAGAALLVPGLLAGAIALVIVLVPGGPLAERMARLKSAPLHGTQIDAAAPALSPDGLFAGTWQRQAEAWWNAHLPLRAPAVRATNQVYYSLLGTSHMYRDRIAIGRGQMLFEVGYLKSYCNIEHHAFSADEFVQWAAEIRQIEDYFTRRGQAFIFLITPDKASMHPDHFPAGLDCGTQTRPDYRLAVAALARAGVRTMDGSRAILEAREQLAPELLFARGGTHWTMLGTALVMREMLRTLPPVGGRRLPEPVFRYRVTKNPVGNDADLLDLLNLWRPDRDYPVPELSIDPVAPAPRQAPRLAMVGTSFLIQSREFFERTGLFSQIDHYFYLTRERQRFSGHGWISTPGVDLAPASYDALFAADLVVLEENEGRLRFGYAKQLLQMLGQARTEKSPGSADRPGDFPQGRKDAG